MHFHLPKPLHGWREFAGEVGIIVLGVLSAEQLVETLRWRHEVHGFRASMDRELGRDLGVLAATMRQRPCANHRLDDLQYLLDASTSGHQLKMQRPIDQPLSFSSYMSVWDNKGSEVTEHLPPDIHFRYGEIYDEVRNQDVVRLSQREVWRQLDRFDQPEPLDHQDRMLLRELINRARKLDFAARSNADYINQLARGLGVQLIDDPSLHLPANVSFCGSLFKEEGGGSDSSFGQRSR